MYNSIFWNVQSVPPVSPQPKVPQIKNPTDWELECLSRQFHTTVMMCQSFLRDNKKVVVLVVQGARSLAPRYSTSTTHNFSHLSSAHSQTVPSAPTPVTFIFVRAPLRIIKIARRAPHGKKAPVPGPLSPLFPRRKIQSLLFFLPSCPSASFANPPDEILAVAVCVLRVSPDKLGYNNPPPSLGFRKGERD